MKTVVMTGIAFIACASAAFAAEIEPVVTPGPFSAPPAFPRNQARNPAQEPTVAPGPFSPPPAYPVARVYDWTGFYVGINGGGAFGSAPWISVPNATSGTASFSSGLAGGTAGYNLQTGEPYVLGVEADIDWAGMKATTAPTACAPNPNCEFTMPWLATARLRFGYAFDRILPFVTGGAAIDRLNSYIVGKPFGTDGENSISWTAGGGIEFAFTDAWRAKVEYLYVDLGHFTCNGACGGGPVFFTAHESIIRAGLNYRLWMN